MTRRIIAQSVYGKSTMNVLRDKRYWLGAGAVVVLVVAMPLIVIASGMMNMSVEVVSPCMIITTSLLGPRRNRLRLNPILSSV